MKGYHHQNPKDMVILMKSSGNFAKEAGWPVEPDGNTYRYKIEDRCPTCGTPANNTSSTTPTTSCTVIAGGGAVVAGGECSTTTSPRCIDPTNNNHIESTTTPTSSTYIRADGSAGGVDMKIPLPFYMYRGLAGGLNHPTTTKARAV